MRRQEFLCSNFLFSSVSMLLFFFYIKSFSIINRSLFLFYFFQDLSSIAFISSKNLVVVGSMTGLIGWVLLSAALSLFNLPEGRQ